jgi:hypothetical protein
MGYLFLSECVEKKQIVERLVKGTKKHKVVGNRLWYVAKDSESGSDFIGLCLLSKSEGHWGYKSLSESMGPYYYDCPLKFLEETAGVSSANQEWRELVHEEAKKKGRKISVGDKIVAYNRTYQILEDLGRKGFAVENIENGTKYRMPRTWLKNVEIL